MEQLTDKLTINEFFRIFLPGIYFTTLSNIFLDSINFHLAIFYINRFYGQVFFVIFSVILGLLIYSIDLPKKINFFKKNLPTTMIQNKHPEINPKLIANSFFSYLDNEGSKETQILIKSYDGYFHLGINILLVSLTFMIISVLKISKCYDLLVLTSLTFIVSLALAILIFNNKIKSMFERQVKAYFSSQAYSILNK